MLKITAEQGDITTWQGDAIVVNLFEGTKTPGGATAAVDKALNGAIQRIIDAGDFSGKLGETTLLYGTADLSAERVLVVGLGKQEDLDLDALRRATGKAARALKATKARKVASIVHGAGQGGLQVDAAAQAITEAALSATYSFERKTKDEDDEPEDRVAELVLLEHEANKAEAAQAGVARGNAIGNAQAVARDIASFSGAEGTATAIADFVARTCKETGIDCTVLDKKAIQAEKMGGLLAVNQGSEEEPRFLVLDWHPEGATETICLVGKGVTFDTGGISIKPSKGMDKMRYDKSGAAGTIGTVLAAAQLDLPLRVIGLTPLTDNMPSGKAVKPGDVITMRSGKTVEVLNTDAEGRLILADALDYAKQFEPRYTVDMATLTGACTVAVGTQCIALMSSDDELIEALREAGDASHERVWPLPFYEEYGEQIEGSVADIKNVGGRPAGAITAGKFLEHFAPEEGWAHLDIASTAWNSTKPHFNGDYYPSGVTGVGVRLLATWLNQLA
ncbi:MAG: leucyl aminopeptidase [Candidatus Thermoplasmatota archaeon]|nr:leucyl aminopeptidase [Candidatus Thermoplasmatota archaeon]